MKDSNIKDIRKLCQYWHKQGAVFFRKTTSENDIVGIVYCPYNDKPREKDSAEKHGNWLAFLIDMENEKVFSVTPAIVENTLLETGYESIVGTIGNYLIAPFIIGFQNANGNAYIAENGILFQYLPHSAETKPFDKPENGQFIKGKENIAKAIHGLRKFESAQEMVSFLRDKL